jgi:hypothetical protein
MSDDIIQGGCLCSSTRYRISGAPLARSICHCRSCRLASGAPAVAWVVVHSDDFTFVSGEPTYFRSSPPVVRTFCPRCGTPLTYQHEDSPETIDVSTATLDAADRFAPTREIWLADKLAWTALNPALPHYRRTSADGDEIVPGSA